MFSIVVSKYRCIGAIYVDRLILYLYIPIFRTAAMKAFISAGVTGLHRWKRLLGLRPPWRSNAAILSEAYLHFEHSVV